VIRKGAQWLVWIAGASLIVMSFVITLETLLRKFAGVSIGTVFEFSAYVFAISSAFAFGWALIQGTHIRISVLRSFVHPRVQAVLDVIAWAVFLVVFAAIAFRAVDLTWESYVSGARSPTPARTLLYIPQAFWAFGLVCTTLTALYLGYRAIVERSTRVITPADEIATELEHLK
jgi:TRAP-type mannitol/chloroaromatic compound transport system permease small subunit